MTKRHVYKVGRPPRDDGPTENVNFRLAAEEHANLKAHVAVGEGTKSELIRAALDAQGLLDPPKKRAR